MEGVRGQEQPDRGLCGCWWPGPSRPHPVGRLVALGGPLLVQLGRLGGQGFPRGKAGPACHPWGDLGLSGPVTSSRDLRESVPWLFHLEPNVASCNLLPGFSHCLCQGPSAWHGPRGERRCVSVSVLVSACIRVCLLTFACVCVRVRVCAQACVCRHVCVW